MTKYREILRLTALGLSLRDIEKSLKVSRKTVVKVQKRADELSLSWPLDESLTDAELEQRMFPKDLSPKSTKRMPDFDYIRKELLKNGKGQILRPTPNTAPLICGACYNTQPEDLLTMA